LRVNDLAGQFEKWIHQMTEATHGEHERVTDQAPGHPGVMEDSSQPATTGGRLLAQYAALVRENPDAFHGLLVMAAVKQLGETVKGKDVAEDTGC
jgi:hypothetical protein